MKINQKLGSVKSRAVEPAAQAHSTDTRTQTPGVWAPVPPQLRSPAGARSSQQRPRGSWRGGGDRAAPAPRAAPLGPEVGDPAGTQAQAGPRRLPAPPAPPRPPRRPPARPRPGLQGPAAPCRAIVSAEAGKPGPVIRSPGRAPRMEPDPGQPPRSAAGPRGRFVWPRPSGSPRPAPAASPVCAAAARPAPARDCHRRRPAGFPRAGEGAPTSKETPPSPYAHLLRSSPLRKTRPLPSNLENPPETHT